MARIWPNIFRVLGGEIPPDYRINGGFVDRNRPVPFRFNGRGYRGFAGDTLASALLAQGVAVPQNISLLRAGEQPAATLTAAQELYDDLTARHRTNGHFRRFLPGYAPSVENGSDAETEHVYDHADCVIVGSGPVGLATALQRAEAGLDVILVERDFDFGGSLLYDDEWIDGRAPGDWRQEILARLSVMPNIRMLNRTTALAREGETRLHTEERPQQHLNMRDPHLPDLRLRHIQAREMVFSTGNYDQIFAFENNRLHGIFNLEYALSLVNRHAVLPGHRLALYVGHTGGYRLAASLLARGLRPAAIIDARAAVPAVCHRFARQAGIPLYPSHQVIRAQGFRRVRRLVIRKAGNDPLNRDIHLDCDSLVQSAGVIPRSVPELLEDSSAASLTGRTRGETLPHLRRGPLFQAQVRAAALHRTVHGWRLAAAYPKKDEKVRAASHREALAAWTGVAMSDLSHLGKIDLQGPDALALLERAFGGWANLKTGRMRPFLLTEDGGIALATILGWRVAPQHFLLTVAAGSLAAVRTRLERLVAAEEIAPRLKMTEVTDEWGGIALVGPKAEALLADSLPMSVMSESLPPMAFRDFSQDDLPVRLARVSLSVGAGYEIYTRAGYADILWNLLLEKGKAQGLTLAGTTAREILRIEAGRPGVREINGRTTAADLGLAPPDRLQGRHKSRWQLVGLKSVSHEVEGKPAPPLSVGMTLYEGDGTEMSGPGIGEITSACYSPAHDREIALALLSDGRARAGTLIRAATADGRKEIDVKVQPPRVQPRKEIGHA